MRKAKTTIYIIMLILLATSIIAVPYQKPSADTFDEHNDNKIDSGLWWTSGFIDETSGVMRVGYSGANKGSGVTKVLDIKDGDSIEIDIDRWGQAGMAIKIGDGTINTTLIHGTIASGAVGYNIYVNSTNAMVNTSGTAWVSYDITNITGTRQIIYEDASGDYFYINYIRLRSGPDSRFLIIDFINETGDVYTDADLALNQQNVKTYDNVTQLWYRYENTTSDSNAMVKFGDGQFYSFVMNTSINQTKTLYVGDTDTNLKVKVRTQDGELVENALVTAERIIEDNTWAIIGSSFTDTKGEATIRIADANMYMIKTYINGCENQTRIQSITDGWTDTIIMQIECENEIEWQDLLYTTCPLIITDEENCTLGYTTHTVKSFAFNTTWQNGTTTTNTSSGTNGSISFWVRNQNVTIEAYINNALEANITYKWFNESAVTRRVTITESQQDWIMEDSTRTKMFVFFMLVLALVTAGIFHNRIKGTGMYAFLIFIWVFGVIFNRITLLSAMSIIAFVTLVIYAGMEIWGAMKKHG